MLPQAQLMVDCRLTQRLFALPLFVLTKKVTDTHTLRVSVTFLRAAQADLSEPALRDICARDDWPPAWAVAVARQMSWTLAPSPWAWLICLRALLCAWV
jgi:hypothetical protein